jgi:DNA replication protein DnaC
MIDETISMIKRQYNKLNPPQQSDYIGEDGLLYCGKCHTRKQRKITICEVEKVVPVVCKCRAAELERQKEIDCRNNQQKRINQLIREGVYETGYSDCTFANDDGKNSKISKTCRRYVDKWEEVKAKNIGLMFYGPKGTGKSFFAYSIANSLIAKGVPVCITSFTRLLNAAMSLDKRQSIIDRLNVYDLLVLDDIGAERQNDKGGVSYSQEQMFNIINGRYGIKKPLIVTTNYDVETFSNPSDIAYGRIYDRILEMCPVRIKIDGESRRTAIAAKQRDEFIKILEE